MSAPAQKWSALANIGSDDELRAYVAERIRLDRAKRPGFARESDLLPALPDPESFDTSRDYWIACAVWIDRERARRALA